MRKGTISKELFEKIENMSTVFSGQYYAPNTTKEYMYGVFAVMEAIACEVGADFADDFTAKFIKNMQKSVDRKYEVCYNTYRK